MAKQDETAGGYRVVRVSERGGRTLAVLTTTRVLEHGSDAWRADLGRLAREAAGPVDFDLPVLEAYTHSLFGQLITLDRGLRERSLSLTIYLSPRLRDATEKFGSYSTFF